MPGLGWRPVHLLVAATLAITQPLLGFLGENPTFFTAHSAAPRQVLAFVAVVSLAPGAAFSVLTLVGHAVSARLGRTVFTASMTVLVFVFVVQVVDVMPGPPIVGLVVAAAASGGLMALYAAHKRVRDAVSVLAVFPPVVAGLFLFASPVNSIVFPAEVDAVTLEELLGQGLPPERGRAAAGDGLAPLPESAEPRTAAPEGAIAAPEARAAAPETTAAGPEGAAAGAEGATAAPEDAHDGRAEPDDRPSVPDAPEQPPSVVDRLNARFPPIYLLVLDEVPWASLLDRDGRIDAARYPNFARLGAKSHVFSNATTVASTTERAVPAMLASTLQTQPAPVYSMYPDNLFTLLGGVYDVSSSDPLVDLCPPSVCDGSPPAQVLELIQAEATLPLGDSASEVSSTTTPAADAATAAESGKPSTTTAAASTTAPASVSTTTAPVGATTATASTTTAPVGATTATASTTTAPVGAAGSQTRAAADIETRREREGSLLLLLEDAAIVFAHLAAPSGLDLGLPSIKSEWRGFARDETARSVIADTSTPSATPPEATTEPDTTTADTTTSPATTSPATAGTADTAAAPTAATGTDTAGAPTAATGTDTAGATAESDAPGDDTMTGLTIAAGGDSHADSGSVDPQRLAEERTAFLDSLITSDARVVDFRAEIAAIQAGKLPRLHYLHALLPHLPWRFRPDGSSYADIATPGYSSGWDGSLDTARFGQQRHLLQLGLVDGLLGEYLDRLEAVGDFDRAIVIVTADHGMSFVPGEPSRGIGEANAGGIANVPLIYKEPGQRAGTVQPQPVQLIDIVPTIAARLGIDPPWVPEGRDMFTEGPARVRRVTGPFGAADIPHELPAVVETLAADMHSAFGDGASGSLYALGGASELIGAETLAWSGQLSPHCWTPERPTSVPEPDGSIGYVYGRISAPVGDPIDFALSVDGLVAATSRSLREGSGHRVYAIGDPSFWQGDEPHVELHQIIDGRLALIPYCP